MQDVRQFPDAKISTGSLFAAKVKAMSPQIFSVRKKIVGSDRKFFGHRNQDPNKNLFFLPAALRAFFRHRAKSTIAMFTFFHFFSKLYIFTCVS
jgi:uncharacterized UBP type Zn finger protein